MLCGLLEPSGGETELAGETGSLRSEFVRQRVGYMSQKFSLYNDLSIKVGKPYRANPASLAFDRINTASR
jgi:ABC-2 type transport system ATP-binding protein